MSISRQAGVKGLAPTILAAISVCASAPSMAGHGAPIAHPAAQSGSGFAALRTPTTVVHTSSAGVKDFSEATNLGFGGLARPGAQSGSGAVRPSDEAFLPMPHGMPAAQSGSGWASPGAQSGSGRVAPSAQSGSGLVSPAAQSGSGWASPGAQSGSGHVAPSAQSGSGLASPGAQSGSGLASPGAQSGSGLAAPGAQSGSG
jgi:hypothetical protein